MNQYVTGAVSPDRIQMVKLYPEGEAGARFKINAVKKSIFTATKVDRFWLLR